MPKLVDIYPYQLHQNSGSIFPEFFIGKRSPNKRYGGQWRMIAGKVKQNETAWQAALRELKEELGVTPLRFWTVPTLNQFYEPETDLAYHIPVFAAEILLSSEIILNEEHNEHKWITIEEIEHYIHWPEQVRCLELIHKKLISDTIIEDWEIPLTQ